MLEKRLWEHATDYPCIPLERYSSLTNDPKLINWQILDAEELQKQYLEAVQRGDEDPVVWMRLEMAYRFANGLVQFNEHLPTVFCTVWTDIQIDKQKKLILVKGYDYARIEGSTLLKTPQDDEWRKYDALYENWKLFRSINPNLYPNTKDGVLGWLNYNTYRKLKNELKGLKTTEEEDEKWKQSGDAQFKKDYGVTLRDDLEIHSIRNDERKLLKQAINELEMWYRKHNLNAPDLELESQIRQMEERLYSDREKLQEDREQMQNEVIKQTVLRDWERREREEQIGKKEEEIKQKDKIINVLIDKSESKTNKKNNQPHTKRKEVELFKAARTCYNKSQSKKYIGKKTLIEICREYLTEHSIKGKPDYTAELLSNYSLKLKHKF